MKPRRVKVEENYISRKLLVSGILYESASPGLKQVLDCILAMTSLRPEDRPGLTELMTHLQTFQTSLQAAPEASGSRIRVSSVSSTFYSRGEAESKTETLMPGATSPGFSSLGKRAVAG